MLIFSYWRAHWRWWALLGALALGIATGALGATVSVERSLQQLGWRLHQHPAGGDLDIVEIDARSISAIDRWPWPRSNYARLIDRLRRAHVASIAFDVDFSSRSSPAEDTALAQALARAGGKVILPTFRQAVGGGRQGRTDSLAIPQLRDHSMAAAVNIQPDNDGYVRRAPLGTITDGAPRPSLSAIIAGHAGSADQDFPVDFSIDPSSIPRHSFIDIQQGNFDPSALAGKNVLIGATAVETGDRYVVPIYGSVPGVVLQALATETLIHGRPRETGWPVGLIPAALLAWGLVSLRSRKGLAAGALAAPIVLCGLAFAAQTTLDWYIDVVPAIAVVIAASAAAAAMHLADAARRRRLHDVETGLPNRFALEEALRSATHAGLIAARILEFDKIAAALGAVGAAELILRVRDRIAHLQEDTLIYRVEDRVLCWRCDDKRDLDRRLTTLRTIMLEPIEVQGRRVDAKMVIGYARGPGSDSGQLVANAAFAAAKARNAGLAWHVHDTGDDEEIERELSLLGELDEAVLTNQIDVLYQPKLSIAKRRIVSVEALVRWHHPTRGLLTPDLFIPLAEQNDRIAGLTLYVVARTIADLAAWHAAGHHITGAVNVSGKLLNSSVFIAQLRRLIERSAVDPACITVEVTESAAMHDPQAAAAALNSFRELGIGVSIDDYGTGHSTLSYLKLLPLNELKIDRSFVRLAHLNRGDAVLVRSTVDLAHELGLEVVAEGVEEAGCLAYLGSIGCDMAQGHLISRPISAHDLVSLLDEQASEAA
jgi:EAL domain-containing protein (putative c-di-GMP-specific phosphodiesterase class I)/CHASE2 domain-containing sensor protein